MQARARETAVVLPMASDADLAVWERLDDVIMGGQSSSTLRAAGDGSCADFSGDLIIEGGGFCGARTKVRVFVRQYLCFNCFDTPAMQVCSMY